jgi:hypothetical protein
MSSTCERIMCSACPTSTKIIKCGGCQYSPGGLRQCDNLAWQTLKDFTPYSDFTLDQYIRRTSRPLQHMQGASFSQGAYSGPLERPFVSQLQPGCGPSGNSQCTTRIIQDKCEACKSLFQGTHTRRRPQEDQVDFSVLQR